MVVLATSGEVTRRREKAKTTDTTQRTQTQEQEEKEDDVEQRFRQGVEFKF